MLAFFADVSFLSSWAEISFPIGSNGLKMVLTGGAEKSNADSQQRETVYHQRLLYPLQN
jgi:hypothetical protein